MTTFPTAADDRAFVLTGAGVNAESGLPAFHASHGLWAGHRVEDVCASRRMGDAIGSRMGVLTLRGG